MNEQNWFGWLDNKSEDNLIWAVTYLIKKGGLKIDDRGQRASPQEHIDHYNQRIFPHSFYSDEKKELFIKKMKAALSQRENRSKHKLNHKKAYSFIMNKNIQKQLKQLAGDRPINETLERLINNTEAFRQAIKAELTESIKPPKTRTDGLVTARSDEQKVKKLTLIKEVQEKVLQQLLKDLCKYEYIHEKNHFEPLPLVTDDYAHIEAKYEKRKTIIRTEIKNQLGVMSLSLKASQIDIFGDEAVRKEDNNEEQ
jgi:hypothetical protein